MERLLVLLIALVTLLVVKTDISNSVFIENYVTPNKIVGCSASRSQDSCLTLQEYASQPDVYFKNDTVFYFEPGVHEWNSSLKLENLNNVTLQGLSGNNALKPRISFKMFVTVTWKKCWNIEISSVTFLLLDNFTHVIVFSQAQAVLLQDIFIISGDTTVSGCSSILCQRSNLK
jgi:hypothetical protein